MMNQNIGIIILSEVAKEKALQLHSELGGKLYSTRELEGFEKIEDLQEETGQIMEKHDLVLFCNGNLRAEHCPLSQG